MTTRLAFSILLANLVLVFGAGILFVFGTTFGPIWWGLYAGGAVIGALISKNDFKFQISNFKSSFGSVWVVLLLHAVLLLVACGVASRFLDVGWDSLETHQRAVHLIREGWNIVSPQEGWLGQQPVDGLLRIEPSLYTAHLDFNAMYVVSSLMGDLPFGFEGAKGYRILLLIMVGILVTDLLIRAGLGKGWARVVGLFVALNPVCLYQLWVLFMDFEVAVYSTLAVVALYSLSWGAGRRAAWVALLAILLLLVSKRSGLALALPLGGLLFVWVAFARSGVVPKMRRFFSGGSSTAAPVPRRRGKFLAVAAITMLGLAGLILLIAASVRNGQSRQGDYYSLGFVHRAVFQPDEFDKSLDLVVPRSHQGLSRPEQFLRALFEKTDIYRGDSPKLPFTWVPDEWETFRNIHWPGHGSGGFGPFFSGVLVLSILAGLLALRPWPPVRSPGWLFRLTLFLVLVGVCFLLPSWWARWVPFVWVLPLFFLLTPLFLRPRHQRASLLLLADRDHLVPTLCAGGALTLAIVNSVILFGISMDETARVTDSIDDALRSLSGQEVVLDPGRNLLTKRWLLEREVDYRLSDERGPLIFELEPSTSRVYQLPVSP